jgi:hypothetical protein
MKTKLIFLLLIFSASLQAQIVHLKYDNFRYKLNIWDSWQVHYDTVGIEWDFGNNTLEIKDGQDYTFDLVYLSHKVTTVGRDAVTRWYYASINYDGLKMTVTIDRYQDRRYTILLVQKGIRIQYFCKELKDEFKKE